MYIYLFIYFLHKSVDIYGDSNPKWKLTTSIEVGMEGKFLNGGRG